MLTIEFINKKQYLKFENHSLDIPTALIVTKKGHNLFFFCQCNLSQRRQYSGDLTRRTCPGNVISFYPVLCSILPFNNSLLKRTWANIFSQDQRSCMCGDKLSHSIQGANSWGHFLRNVFDICWTRRGSRQLLAQETLRSQLFWFRCPQYILGWKLQLRFVA